MGFLYKFLKFVKIILCLTCLKFIKETLYFSINCTEFYNINNFYLYIT